MSLKASELSLLVGGAAVEQTPSQCEAWLQAASTGDWTPIFKAALEHGTLALVCWHLQALPDDALAPEIREAAQKFLNQQRTTVEAGFAQWREVLGALEREGIAAIPYKGPVSASAFGELPWLRAFRDLDVLVREPDFDGAIACLEGMGYSSDGLPIAGWQRNAIRRRARQETLYSSGLAVEPHYGFAQRSLGLELKVDDVFARARAGQVLGHEVRVMAPEDTFLVLALHGCKERWRRLVWVVDVAEYLKSNPDLDWDIAFRRARACGLERCSLLALHLAHELLGAPVPAAWLRQARASPVCLELSARVKGAIANEAPIDKWSEVMRFQNALLERNSDRLRAWTETVKDVREGDYAAVRLPRATAGLYMLVKATRRISALLPRARPV
ncbi:MAG: hypothetical protein JWP57_4545 [Spirosoma sp.]|nr:hypothetical protein [Spirosoma sp.]